MIVKSAKRYMWLPEAQKALEKNCSPNWDYLEIVVGRKEYAIVFEFSKAYGQDIIRQWMIDGRTQTGVPWKYPELPGTVEFDCTNGQIGIRAFEHNSLTWEFLLKPLGLHWLDIAKIKPYNMIGRHQLKELLTASNIGFIIVKEGSY